MKLNELKPAKGAVKKRKRVGCGTGSGHGGTSTRGHKGHKARSGGTGGPIWFEGGQMPLTRRVPKFGFTNIFRKEYQVVNLEALNRFQAGTEVDPGVLRKAGLIRRPVRVKLLATGALDRALTIKVHAASEAARAKVEAAGGRLEILEDSAPKAKK